MTENELLDAAAATSESRTVNYEPLVAALAKAGIQTSLNEVSNRLGARTDLFMMFAMRACNFIPGVREALLAGGAAERWAALSANPNDDDDE